MEQASTIIPISERKALIEERTGAKVKQYGQIFRLNPRVSDIADRYAYRHNGVALLVLGAVDRGGGGCACPESVLLRALVMDLVLERNEALVMDMEAGVEHLGRSTAKGVDALIVVLEPGQRSIETGQRIVRMAQEIGLSNIQFAGNKTAGPDDEAFIQEAFPGSPLLGIIPYAEGIRMSDRTGRSVLDTAGAEMRERFAALLTELERRLVPGPAGTA